jgi:hypothetical protein
MRLRRDGQSVKPDVLHRVAASPDLAPGLQVCQGLMMRNFAQGMVRESRYRAGRANLLTCLLAHRRAADPVVPQHATRVTHLELGHGLAFFHRDLDRSLAGVGGGGAGRQGDDQQAVSTSLRRLRNAAMRRPLGWMHPQRISCNYGCSCPGWSLAPSASEEQEQRPKNETHQREEET